MSTATDCISAKTLPSPLWIDARDSRHETLQKGFNLRWPPSPAEGAMAVGICSTWQEVLEAANRALSNGYRITVRSGGHCYEGFVANRDGDVPLVILDLSQMNSLEWRRQADIPSQVAPGSSRYRFRIAAGAQNWDTCVALYKQAGKTLPGGTCYSVGMGGHICGGGYGPLSRLYGLTADWLSAVDILIPDSAGKTLIARHIGVHSQGLDRELFIACRGAGGGNFGIILNYYFTDLPPAPSEAYMVALTYDWNHLGRDAFRQVIQTYTGWLRDNDHKWNDIRQGNGGLFAILNLHARASGNITLYAQYNDRHGKVGQGHDQPFHDFIQAMSDIPGARPSRLMRRMDWLPLMQETNGSGSNLRAKHKSDYRITGFSPEEIDVLWQRFHDQGQDPRLGRTFMEIISYGGAVNAYAGAADTCIAHRRSILKCQLMTRWADPEQDAFRLDWIRQTYRAIYQAGHGHDKPYPDGTRYEGCYINYPDIDMKYLDSVGGAIDPRWLELYYGNRSDFLIRLKRAIDPKNLFRHTLSIPLQAPAG